MSGLQCVINQHTAHACALAMAYGCLVWVGGPRAGVVAQPRCLAGYIPGIYLVYQYTWYIPGIYYPPKPLYRVYAHPYLWQLRFWLFLPFLGSWHAATASPWPLGLCAPKSVWLGLPASPKRAPRAQQAALQHGCQNTDFPF